MKYYSFTLVCFFTSIIISCSSNNSNQSQKNINSNIIDFQASVNILAKVDSCDTLFYSRNYTTQNTLFYQLNAKKNETMLLVETSNSCGYTGSCGNRILVIKNEEEIIFETCAFLYSTLDTKSQSIKDFVLLYRNFTPTIFDTIKVSWNNNKFNTKRIKLSNTHPQ